MIIYDKMRQDVIIFQGVWVLHFKLSLELIFYQTCGIRCDKVWEDVIKFLRAWILNLKLSRRLIF